MVPATASATHPIGGRRADPLVPIRGSASSFSKPVTHGQRSRVRPWPCFRAKEAPRTNHWGSPISNPDQWARKAFSRRHSRLRAHLKGVLPKGSERGSVTRSSVPTHRMSDQNALPPQSLDIAAARRAALRRLGNTPSRCTPACSNLKLETSTLARNHPRP
jgi:hypothetical protein